MGFENNILFAIQKQLEDEFDKIKEKKLKEIDDMFESKRNEVIAKTLLGISIFVERDMDGITPIINIKIINNNNSNSDLIKGNTEQNIN